MAAHVLSYRLSDAQITAAPSSGPVILEHGLALVVQEGRFENLQEREDGSPAPSTLDYTCFVNEEGAPAVDIWTGIDAHIVITGTCGNGSLLTIVGQGAIGRDNGGTLEVSFDIMPQILVIGAATAKEPDSA